MNAVTKCFVRCHHESLNVDHSECRRAWRVLQPLKAPFIYIFNNLRTGRKVVFALEDIALLYPNPCICRESFEVH